MEKASGENSHVIDRGTFEGRVVSKERKNRERQGHPVPAVGDADVLCGADADNFTPDELREFLAADYLETQADPTFKESLRKRLWTLVSDRYGPDSSSSDSS